MTKRIETTIIPLLKTSAIIVMALLLIGTIQMFNDKPKAFDMYFDLDPKSFFRDTIIEIVISVFILIYGAVAFIIGFSFVKKQEGNGYDDFVTWMNNSKVLNPVNSAVILIVILSTVFWYDGNPIVYRYVGEDKYEYNAYDDYEKYVSSSITRKADYSDNAESQRYNTYKKRYLFVEAAYWDGYPRPHVTTGFLSFLLGYIVTILEKCIYVLVCFTIPSFIIILLSEIKFKE